MVLGDGVWVRCAFPRFAKSFMKPAPFAISYLNEQQAELQYVTNFAAKWCNGAPTIERGLVRAVSTGNSFGVVCHGTDADDPEPLPTCPNVAVLYTKLQPGLAGYQMYYTTDSVRADKIFLRTRFDAPVLTIDVST